MSKVIKVFVLESISGEQYTTFRSDDKIVNLFRAGIADELRFVSKERPLQVKGFDQSDFYVRMVGTAEKETESFDSES